MGRDNLRLVAKSLNRLLYCQTLVPNWQRPRQLDLLYMQVITFHSGP